MSETESDTIVEARDLHKSFGGVTAVDGASFEVPEGVITGLIGPNGAGKTTTFDLLSGFLKPDGGSVRYKGRDTQEIMRPSLVERAIWGSSSALALGGSAFAVAASTGAAVPLVAGVVGAAAGAGVYEGQERVGRRLGRRNSRPFRLAREGLVRTFQITRELERMTVLENMMLAAKEQRGENVVNAWLWRRRVNDDEGEIRDRALERLELLEIDHLADEYAGGLSGGQRKLLELGRVLMAEPDVVLLDEPVAGVNPTLTDKITGRIETLRDDGYTFLVVEHDMEVVMELSDRLIAMDEGSVIAEGEPDEVREDERVVDAYLGGEIDG